MGSNGTHPYEGKSTSTHACAFFVVTVSRSPEPAGSPGVKPTATLAGMPSVRSITAIALENCWQKPTLVCSRNSSIASSLVEPGTVSS